MTPESRARRALEALGSIDYLESDLIAAVTKEIQEAVKEARASFVEDLYGVCIKLMCRGCKDGAPLSSEPGYHYGYGGEDTVNGRWLCASVPLKFMKETGSPPPEFLAEED